MGVADPMGRSMCFSLNTHHLKTNMLHNDAKLGNIEEYVFLWNAIYAQAVYVLYPIHIHLFISVCVKLSILPQSPGRNAGTSLLTPATGGQGEPPACVY